MIKTNWFKAAMVYVVTFFISSIIYVFPVIYYLNLLGISVPHNDLVVITFLVSLIITLYLRTKVTFKPLKLFVYVGMVLGFYGLFLSIFGICLQQFIPDYYLIIALPSVLMALIIYGFFNALN